jgi:hypothetical protein
MVNQITAQKIHQKISDGSDLFWVGLDASVTHDEPEQFTRRNADNALGRIELPSVFP